jgi:hypothetical protein
MSEEEKKLAVRFELDIYIITALYLCYAYGIALDALIALYESYGKQCIFAFKMLICKKAMSISDKQLVGIMEESRRLYRMILKRNITLYDFSPKYADFIQWFRSAVVDIYAEEVELQFGYSELYQCLNNVNKRKNNA